MSLFGHMVKKSYWRFFFYLDVMVKLEGNKIITDVYSKPTDTHQYLDFKLCLPKHVKKGIPYGQALRYRRTCSSDEIFEER